MSTMEWKDFFCVEEVYDMPEEYINTEGGIELHYEAGKALACCMNCFGSVNLPWMSENSGLSVAELIEGLEGTIYQDPEGYNLHQLEEGDWMMRDQYVSGNIAAKLSRAKQLNRKYGGRFERNIRLLKEVMPEKVKFKNIGISIGSVWIPENYYSQFAKELLGLKIAPQIFHCKELGQWKVKCWDGDKGAFHNIYTYGCIYRDGGRSKCLSMLEILEKTLNGMTIKIYEEVSRPDRKSGKARVLLKEETMEAQEKQAQIQKAFQEWIGKDRNRVKRLEQIFHDTYVSNVVGQYDGSFLTLSDLNPEFVPYQHQKDGVARIILNRDVLLNHTVGSGKTNILIMGIHERKRMGLSEKNLVVVPNNVLEAFERAHHYLYPGDSILVIEPKDFRPANRRKILEQIRDEDYVAVYMAFSSFEMLSMSRQYRLDQKAEEIRFFRIQAASAKESWEKQLQEIKVLRLEEELEKMKTELPEDKYLPFDHLGITTLVVDEVHNFKNITLKTSADCIVGMHGSGSKKCNEMMEKVQYIRKNGGSILFSTGTPLTNSISDLYVLQMYLQPEQMKVLKLSHFDEWIGTFATRHTGFEIDVDSQNFRMMTRFSRFHNQPELTGLFAQVCDFYNGTDREVGLPLCDGYVDTMIPKSPEQKVYMEELVLRTEMIRTGQVSGHEDNLLKVTHDGRAAALDIRLVDFLKNPHWKGTKAYACAQNVYKCWKEYPGTAQLVFCDLGTPKKEFNLYDELKYHLIQLGIPEHEIAFVHDAPTDAKRRKLFAVVNRADIRVLIGSTSKLGTGVNVQEKLIAIHHLDVPWKPSDMVQREGRLIRQGNSNERVFRYRYITEGTFDAYSWQIVESKQRFISQFMAGTLVDREYGDIDDAVLTYAEIKALSIGDPLLKTRIETANELERVKIHSCQREKELKEINNLIENIPEKLAGFQTRTKSLSIDFNHFKKNKEILSREERTAFGEELIRALWENEDKTKDRCFDQVHGFSVLLPARMTKERPYVIISGVTGHPYKVDMKNAKPAGCIQRIEYLLFHLEDRIFMTEKEFAKKEEELCQAQAERRKGNPYLEKVKMLNEKLLDIDQELNRRAQKNTF